MKIDQFFPQLQATTASYPVGTSGYEWVEASGGKKLVFYCVLKPVDAHYINEIEAVRYIMSLYGNREVSHALPLIYVWGLGIEPVEFYSSWIDPLDELLMNFLITSKELIFCFILKGAKQIVAKCENLSGYKIEMIAHQLKEAVINKEVNIDNSSGKIEQLRATNEDLYVEKLLWVSTVKAIALESKDRKIENILRSRSKFN